jgi:hypothetical protein
MRTRQSGKRNTFCVENENDGITLVKVGRAKCRSVQRSLRLKAQFHEARRHDTRKVEVGGMADDGK